MPQRMTKDLMPPSDRVLIKNINSRINVRSYISSLQCLSNLYFSRVIDFMLCSALYSNLFQDPDQLNRRYRSSLQYLSNSASKSTCFKRIFIHGDNPSMLMTGLPDSLDLVHTPTTRNEPRPVTRVSILLSLLFHPKSKSPFAPHGELLFGGTPANHHHHHPSIVEMSLFVPTDVTITNHFSAPPHDPNNNHHPINLSIPTKPHTTVSSWTSLIAHHCRTGHLHRAAAEFTRMRVAGVEPNHITFVTLLSTCAEFPFQALSFGASVHALVCKLGFLADNVKVSTAIIDMYCKCKRVDLAFLWFNKMGFRNKVTWNTMVSGLMRNCEICKALQVFDEMPERDVVSYTAVIDGFVKKGEYEHGLEWFQEMQVCGVEPDHVAIVSALSACANLGALGLGLWLHRVVLEGNVKENIRVNNSLIDMYSRCGCIEFALQVFHSMCKHNVVSWNSIIVGFALNGNPEESLKYFYRMQKDGFKPDGVTFTGALTACSHAGLVDEGRKLFEVMTEVYRISPRIEHYGCLVDLYSRAGMLEEALNVVENMPMVPNEVVLGSVLAACNAAGDIRLAEQLMRFISELDPSGDSNYVLLSNTYAAGGDWRMASKVRRRMKTRGIEKNPGASLIEIDGLVHRFVAGDKSHVESERIYAMLEVLSRELVMSGEDVAED